LKKLVLIILAVITLAIAANCSVPPVSEEKKNPLAPGQDSSMAGEKKDELETRAEAILSTLTLEEKVGQLLIVGFIGDGKKAIVQDYIDKYKVSGFILFKRNYKDFDSQYELVRSLKERNSAVNPLPLFIAVDEEGGTVSRLPEGGTLFPDASLVSKAGDPTLTRKTGEVIGRELKASGINLNFAPLLDILSSRNNQLLAKRSYGSSAEKVSLHGASFIDGLQSTGVIASPKHFPGHGGTNADSHVKLPVVNIDKNMLQERELIPFKAAVKQGIDAVMVGHIAFPKLDPSGIPATMSSYFLTGILRREMGYNGISISDDIEMQGYMDSNASLEECVIASFNAGLDVFVVAHTKTLQDMVLDALMKACSEGRISEERLNESVHRIIKVKLKHKLSDTMEYSLEEAREIFGSKEHKAVLEELNSKIERAAVKW